MPSYSISAEEECCCGIDPTCPAHLFDLFTANADLNISIECVDAACETGCYDNEFTMANLCWPDTGILDSRFTGGASTYAWTGSDLTCDPNQLEFGCNISTGLLDLNFSSSNCSVTIPTTVVFLQVNPFIVTFSTSSCWFSCCDWDGSVCGEYEVLVTISE